MGQPKFARRHYDTPNHPWQGDRIKAEHELRRKFGLKNKTEIWRAQTRLREIRGQARMLISRTRIADDVQAKTEADRLLVRLHRAGYVGEDATLNDVLGMDLERILNRRLQSQVYLKGLARTPKQARQFVSHGHVRIGDRRVSVPGYVVRRDEEELITFDPTSPVGDEDHPVRPKAPGVEVMEAAAETVEAEAPVARPRGPAVAPGAASRAPKSEAEPSVKDAEAKPKTEAKAEAKPKADAKAEAKPAASAEPKADKPKEEAKAEAKPAATAKPKAEKAEAKPAKAEAKADKPKEEAKPKAEPKAAAKADKPKEPAKKTKEGDA
jgi:small subunit ribosomal protein S4